MGRLNTKEFLDTLAAVLAKNDGQSSIYLVQKRLTSNLTSEPSEAMGDLASNVILHPSKYPTNTEHYPVLVRMSDGDKKSKISTVVEADKLDSFWSEYAQVLKDGFVGLRKKDKKKKKNKVTKD